MPQRGRPPQPGTAAEKAAIRREKVRLYVKAHRERKKYADSVASSASPGSRESKSSSPPSVDSQRSTRASSIDNADQAEAVASQHPDDLVEHQANDEALQHQWVVIKSKHKQSTTNVTISVAPNGNKELGFALLGAFRGQFLPPVVLVPSRQSHGSELVTPCSPWITNAYDIAVSQDSGALKSCLLATALAMTSMQNQDQRLKMASLDVYHKALRQVRNDVKSLTNGTTTNYLIPYLSCLAAAMFEIVHDGFSENIMQHIKGAISLMQLVSKDANVNHLLGDLLLEDLCMWEIVFALKYRYPSPLRPIRQRKGARNYVVDGDAKTSSRNATTLGDLLDCADEISTIMAKVDGLKQMPNSDLKTNQLHVVIASLKRILKAFDEWISRFHRRFGSPYVQVGTDDATGAPITQFRSYELAAAWVYCLTFQICAIETNIEVLAELLQSSQACPPLKMEQYDTDVVLRPRLQSLPAHATQTTHVKQPTIHQQSLNPSTSKTYAQLQTSRAELRLLTTQLVEALCLFLPIPKGIIGSSLILFPLDRAKAMLKKEITRLQCDQADTKASGMEDDAGIVAELNDMFQSMTVYETLEQALAQFGMPPMPED